MREGRGPVLRNKKKTGGDATGDRNKKKTGGDIGG
jgi:hypothetical protein